MSSSTIRSGRPFIGAVEDEWPVYSDRAEDYTLGPPIGFGASSIVYHATWRPKGKGSSPPLPCAVKVLDLDTLPPSALHLLRRETALMSLSKHPNVLRVRGSWMDGHHLCIALRLMNAGSAADVMRYAWPGGMEEEVVKCILKQALEGLKCVPLGLACIIRLLTMF
jgi:serine/threonine-protein kinase OSR1/STK39